MTKTKSVFACQSCGSIQNKWAGKCPDCNAWNTLVEENISAREVKVKFNSDLNFTSLNILTQDEKRLPSSNSELDRVLGGGLVKGSAILIGGDPGIGKSTLLLQLVADLSSNNTNCAYISGEESINQIQLRAKRLGLHQWPVNLLTATNIEEIIALLQKQEKFDLIVIDSIQTMFMSSIASAPGTVAQVKATSHELINFAKKNNIIIIFVGHVTKEGQIAGPKILEHIVDTVLYFEGDRDNHFRIVRSVKNRFGGINEIGVFEMTNNGLRGINNPSALFLSPNERQMSGTSVFAGLEGTRPILVEMQSLIAPSYLPTPRRAVVGWDTNRLAMIIAVLNSRYGLNLLNKEIYLNVVGGFKVTEPAADLAAMCSIISSYAKKPLPEKSVIFGEIGLSGEVRQVPHFEARLKEAQKLGFSRAIVPSGYKYKNHNIKLTEINHIRELKDLITI